MYIYIAAVNRRVLMGLTKFFILLSIHFHVQSDGDVLLRSRLEGKKAVQKSSGTRRPLVERPCPPAARRLPGDHFHLSDRLSPPPTTTTTRPSRYNVIIVRRLDTYLPMETICCYPPRHI